MGDARVSNDRGLTASGNSRHAKRPTLTSQNHRLLSLKFRLTGTGTGMLAIGVIMIPYFTGTSAAASSTSFPSFTELHFTRKVATGKGTASGLWPQWLSSHGP